MSMFAKTEMTAFSIICIIAYQRKVILSAHEYSSNSFKCKFFSFIYNFSKTFVLPFSFFLLSTACFLPQFSQNLTLSSSN